MGDTTNAPATDAPSQLPAAPPTAPATGQTDDRLPDDHPVVKALKKANEEAASARKSLQAIEDAGKSELQKATDGFAAEKSRADGLETELHQLRSALKHEIALEDVDLLGTGTADEIEARAKRLAGRDSTRKKQSNRVPKEGTNTPAAASDERAFVRELFGSGG